MDHVRSFVLPNFVVETRSWGGVKCPTNEAFGTAQKDFHYCLFPVKLVFGSILARESLVGYQEVVYIIPKIERTGGG